MQMFGLVMNLLHALLDIIQHPIYPTQDLSSVPNEVHPVSIRFKIIF